MNVSVEESIAYDVDSERSQGQRGDDKGYQNAGSRERIHAQGREYCDSISLAHSYLLARKEARTSCNEVRRGKNRSQEVLRVWTATYKEAASGGLHGQTTDSRPTSDQASVHRKDSRDLEKPTGPTRAANVPKAVAKVKIRLSTKRMEIVVQRRCHTRAHSSLNVRMYSYVTSTGCSYKESHKVMKLLRTYRLQSSSSQ